jgi:hypothetical protein
VLVTHRVTLEVRDAPAVARIAVGKTPKRVLVVTVPPRSE